MNRWMYLAATVLLCAMGSATIGFAQGELPPDFKFLIIGDVSKVDVKNKSVAMNNAASYNVAQPENAAGGGNNAGGGLSRGGVSVRGGESGGRGGRRGGGGAVPGTGRGPSALPTMDYKVTVSTKTVIKEGDNAIKIEDLKIGDHLQVYSMKGGSKVDALQ